MKEDNSKNYSEEINRRIEEMFKDGKIVLGGPISSPNGFWKESKNLSTASDEFMDYLKSEREKCKKMSEVSNDPTFWLGKVDAFMEIENRILKILDQYKKNN
jgi:hypothetical protein